MPPIQEEEVTGAYEAYLDPMDAVVVAADGNTAAVRAGVERVLAQAIANGVPQPDLLALSAFAGLAVSSAEEWNAFDWSAAGFSCLDSACQQLMSVFAVMRRSPIGKVVAADVGGCLASVKGWKALKLLLATAAPQALAGECGVRATIASGGALLALM